MKLPVIKIFVALLSCGAHLLAGVEAQSADECPTVPHLSLEFLRIGEDAIYLQTKQVGSTCRWSGGTLDDLPKDVDMNCFGQAVQHPVDTTEYCVEYRLENIPLDCPQHARTTACTIVHAYSPQPSDAPSSSPSQSPTVSPAPSTSPSDAPSTFPSMSAAPSGMPSLSTAPSAKPSPFPSAPPSSSPSVSSAPSFAPAFLVAHGIEVAFSGQYGIFNARAKDDFESRTLDFLVSNAKNTSEGYHVEIESVRVTNQFIYDDSPGRKLSGAAFHVVFDVAAFVKSNGDNEFDFDPFVSSFFSNQTTLDTIYGDILVESPIYGTESSNLKSDDAASAFGIVSSFVATGILLGGLGAIYMRKRRAKHQKTQRNRLPMSHGMIEFDDHLSSKPTATFDSESIGCGSQNDSETSHLGGYPLGPNASSDLKFQGSDSKSRYFVRGDRIAKLQEREQHSEYQTQFQSPSFQASIIEAENNIEIPLTPVTNLDTSHFSSRQLVEDEDEPSPANSGNIFYAKDAVSADFLATPTCYHEEAQGTDFFRFGKRNQSRSSESSDAAVMLVAYGGRSSSS